MTEEEELDVAFIKRSDEWPWWPYLPVKRHDTDEVAVIVAGDLCVVRHVNLFNMTESSSCVDARETRYGSVAELVAAGWVVD